MALQIDASLLHVTGQRPMGTEGTQQFERARGKAQGCTDEVTSCGAGTGLPAAV